MKIQFPDKTYISVDKSINDKYIISIAYKEKSSLVVSSVELTHEQIKKLFGDIK